MPGETVLIIEDRRENIVFLANNVLKPHGYQIITAMDGQQGLQRALADKPDLIIMDLNMPKMDGLEVLAALRERQVDIPVILTTFYGSEQVSQQALLLGASDYLVKPYSIQEMLRSVEKALANRPPPSPPAEPEAPSPPAEPEAPSPAAEPEEAMPLTRQVERWVRDMNILTRIGKALVALLNVHKVCARAVEATIYITRADHVFLFLGRQGEGTKLCLCATRGPNDRHVRILSQPIEEGLAVQVAHSGKTVLQSKAEKDPFLAKVAGGPLGSLVATPLRWQQEIVGVLIAARRPDEPTLGEADVEWLNGLADYTAIAVRNARAFEQSRGQPAAPGLDERTVMAFRQELDQLAMELQTATETVRRLTNKLAPGGNATDELAQPG